MGLFPKKIKKKLKNSSRSGNKDIEHLRSINILPCLETILELSVYKQFMKHLDK